MQEGGGDGLGHVGWLLGKGHVDLPGLFGLACCSDGGWGMRRWAPGPENSLVLTQPL